MGDERVPAHLELLWCSSEDERFPATNLTRPGGLHLWEAEKFCEFPQELVFRVNQGMPTRIEQVNLLSHPTKVATRIEIFTSTTASAAIYDGKAGVKFDRLGFVCFTSNDTAETTLCELQEVQLPRSTGKITLLRLVLHSCHQARANLFSQVGLAAVAALGPGTETKLPILPSPRKYPANDVISPRRGSDNLFDTTMSRATKENMMKSPRTADIFIEDSQEVKTPEQICADIQIGAQLARFAGDQELVQSWISLGLESKHLLNLLQRSAHPDIRDCSRGTLLTRFAEIEHERIQQEGILCQHMSSSARRNNETSSAAIQGAQTHNVLTRIKTSQGQERETILWNLAEYSQTLSGRRNGLPMMSDGEALEILATALADTNTGVFIAGCAVFRKLLTSLSYFQDAVASKLDITEFIHLLLGRLRSQEAPVRNAAAFTILTVAGSTRVRGTFVTHLLLRYSESKDFQPTDQQLLALLNLIASLVLSFHCCARLDIAPQRIFRFLVRNDTDQHENALVREATKQLIVALCGDVEEDLILKHYVKKLPPDVQHRYDFTLQRNRTEG